MNQVISKRDKRIRNIVGDYRQKAKEMPDYLPFPQAIAQWHPHSQSNYSNFPKMMQDSGWLVPVST